MNVSAVVLAAGASSRLGSDKRSLMLPGGMGLLQLVASRIHCVVDDVVVVIRPDDAGLAAMLRRLGCRACVNARPQAGMGSSLACGIAAAAAADAWVVMPGDLPLVREHTLRQVIAGLSTADAVVPVCHGRRGHPVAFGHRYRRQLLALTGNSGGRHLLQADSAGVTWMNIHDPGIYLDVDTPADVGRLRRLLDGAQADSACAVVERP